MVGSCSLQSPPSCTHLAGSRGSGNPESLRRGLEKLVLLLWAGSVAQGRCAEHRSQAEAQTPPEVTGQAGCFREGGGMGQEGDGEEKRGEGEGGKEESKGGRKGEGGRVSRGGGGRKEGRKEEHKGGDRKSVV